MKTHGKSHPKKRFKKGPARKGHAKTGKAHGGKKPRRGPAAPAAPSRPAENPRAKALAQKMASAVLDKKALDVVILDVRGMTSYADYFVLGSGESERQVGAMADAIHQKLKDEEQLHPIGTEGQETGNWVLLDYGEVVAHLFFTEVRSFYDLEGLWADAARVPVEPPPTPALASGQP